MSQPCILGAQELGQCLLDTPIFQLVVALDLALMTEAALWVHMTLTWPELGHSSFANIPCRMQEGEEWTGKMVHPSWTVFFVKLPPHFGIRDLTCPG